MTIAALSEATVSAITSSLVLNNSISVVKELIDNALDSHATNISVEISSNTLDTIQVKDNGSGIGLEDRQLLCKRGYTSKIRSLEDLAGLGGSSLGFRGEALASLAELSESLTIITRVEGELAGTLLKFDARGKLVSSSSASHGSGTTVKVQNFLKTVPVRQQAALKTAPKILANIKQLLFTYAFARPTTRLQLRILKSKSDFMGNWSYAASQDNKDLSLIASKIVGKEIPKVCKHETITSDDGQFAINALMVANVQTKAPLADQFISIDGRPLNTEGSLMKSFHKIYWSYVKGLVTDQSVLPRRIFLVVHLCCPKGSYDVNIEPAKDEVMFEDVQIVTRLFEELCIRVYGHPSATNLSKKITGPEKAVKQRSFDLLMAKRPDPSLVADKASSPEGTHVAKTVDTWQNAPTSVTGTSSGSSFYESNPESEDGRRDYSKISTNADKQVDHISADPAGSDDENDLMRPQITNPFVLAKLNSRIDRSGQTQTHTHAHLPGEAEVLCYDRLSGPESVNNFVPVIKPGLQATGFSSSLRDQSTPPSLTAFDSTQAIEKGSSDEVDRPAIDSARTPNSSSSGLAIQAVSSLTPTISSASALIDVQKSEPINTTISRDGRPSLGPVVSPIRTGILKQPFRTPFKSTRSATNSISQDSTAPYPSPLSESKKVGSVRKSFRIPSRSLPVGESASELEDIMEFENRKRDHIMQHRLKYQEKGTNHKQLESSNDDEVPACGVKHLNVPSIISSKALYEARFRSEIQTPTVKHNNARSSSAAPTPEGEDGLSPKIAMTTSLSSTSTEAYSQGNGLISDRYESKVERMHPSDPRAILVRSQAKNHVNGHTNLHSKAKISQLPFESINQETATHTVCAFMKEDMNFDLGVLSGQHRISHIHDRPYARGGAIRLAEIESTKNMEDFELCKATAIRMVQERYG